MPETLLVQLGLFCVGHYSLNFVEGRCRTVHPAFVVSRHSSRFASSRHPPESKLSRTRENWTARQLICTRYLRFPTPADA